MTRDLVDDMTFEKRQRVSVPCIDEPFCLSTGPMHTPLPLAGEGTATPLVNLRGEGQ